MRATCWWNISVLCTVCWEEVVLSRGLHCWDGDSRSFFERKEELLEVRLNLKMVLTLDIWCFSELSRSLFSRGQAWQGHGCGSVSGQEPGVSRSRDGCDLKPWIWGKGLAVVKQTDRWFNAAMVRLGNGYGESWGVRGTKGELNTCLLGKRAGEGHGAVKYGFQVEGKHNTDSVLPVLPQERLGPCRVTRRGRALFAETRRSHTEVHPTCRTDILW